VKVLALDQRSGRPGMLDCVTGTGRPVRLDTRPELVARPHLRIGDRLPENDALNWPHCDVLNWPHLSVRS
jgi:hypothetical protein